jgi:hypothetical protein
MLSSSIAAVSSACLACLAFVHMVVRQDVFEQDMKAPEMCLAHLSMVL